MFGPSLLVVEFGLSTGIYNSRAFLARRSLCYGVEIICSATTWTLLAYARVARLTSLSFFLLVYGGIAG